MDANVLMEMVGAIGFPIVCAIGMGWFIYQIFVKTTASHEQQMETMAQRCQAREDKLYEQIDKFNTTLSSFNETLIRIDARLEVLEHKGEQGKTYSFFLF